MTIGVYTDGFITTKCQGFANNRISICRANSNKMNNGGSICFFQFDSTNKRIPFVVWINDPLYTIGIEFRVVISEGYFCRGIRSFADTNKDLHLLNFLVITIVVYATKAKIRLCN